MFKTTMLDEADMPIRSTNAPGSLVPRNVGQHLNLAPVSFLLLVVLAAALLAACQTGASTVRVNRDGHVGESKVQPVTEIPFTFDRNQAIFEVWMNGHGPFNMFLDTGGNPSAVDLAAARTAAIPVDTSAVGEAAGAGGELVPIYAATISGLEFGGAHFGDVQAVALDLGHVSNRLERSLHGVLGYSFLAGKIVQIDYPERVIRIFADSATMREEELGFTMPLRLRPGGTIPLIEAVSVNGLAVEVTLDTGSSLALELYPWAVEELGLAGEFARAEASSVVGARGEESIRQGRVESVRIGPFELGQQDIVFTQKERRRPDQEEGNVGNALLKHFVVTLDYVNGRIGLQTKAHGSPARPR
jgi:hypothetical protein